MSVCLSVTNVFTVEAALEELTAPRSCLSWTIGKDGNGRRYRKEYMEGKERKD